MRKFLKSLLGVLVLGIGSSWALAATAEDVKTIGVSFPHAGQPIVDRLLTFAKVKGEGMGLDVIVDDPGDDLTRQIGTIETWIDGGAVDVVVAVVPNSPEVFNAMAKRSREAGIPWITYAASISNESAFLTWRHEKGGYMLGEEASKWINARPGGKAKVAILGFEQGQWARDRRKGIERGLADHASGAEIVAQQDALQPSVGASVTGSILQAHPDLHAVLAIVPGGGEGAYQAFLNAGHPMDDPDVFIGDVDGSARSLTLISQGTMYRAASTLDLQAIGEAIPELAADLIPDDEAEDIVIPYVMIRSGESEKARPYIEQWDQ